MKIFHWLQQVTNVKEYVNNNHNYNIVTIQNQFHESKTIVLFFFNFFFLVVLDSDSDEDTMAPLLSSMPKPNQAGETKKLIC